MSRLRRAWQFVHAHFDDALVLAAIALAGYGLGQFHSALTPLAWSAGLFLIVRFG